MAIPKTPRNGASKAAGAEDINTVDAVPNAEIDSVVEAVGDATPENPPEPVLDAAPPEVDVKTDSVEDAAVILDEPEPPVEDAPIEDTPIAPPADDAPRNTPEPELAPDLKPDLKSDLKSESAPNPTPQPAPTVVKSGPGFVPMVLGGVVAAGIGFGLATFVVPAGWPVPGASPLQTQLTQQAEEIASLRAAAQTLGATATSALETAQAAQQAIAALPQTPPETGPDLQPEIAALADRLTALENRPVAAPVTDNPALIDGLKADIATLQSGLDAQQAQADDLMKAAETARAEAAAEAQTVLLQAALTKVEAAMQNGLPFADDLARLAATGVTIPDILTQNAETGLPTINALTQGFADPARAALQASLRGNMGDTWGQRLGTFWKSQTGARSLTPQEGDDPDAVLSRADAAVAAGDLQAALTEIATLPEVAQAALADWVAQVKLRNDAQTATADLAAALSER